ncbi:MAG: threonine/serine dehydratase [bacterium]|nr:threonine/serine dehydratase [bacterium]
MVGLNAIREARSRLAGHITRTRLEASAGFSRMSGHSVYLKPENLQKTGAFKIRGATNHILQIDPALGRRGVIAASSGNHGQAVAHAAARAGYPAVVVVPEGASAVKVAAARGYGAEVIYHGTTSAERAALAGELARERGLTFIHPFDDPWVIAGQGTVGLEILEDLPEVDLVLAPVGGGGLIAGIAVAIKESRPGTLVYGVEPVGGNSMQRSLQAGAIATIEQPRSVADGLLPTRPGEITFELARKYVDGVLTVTDAEIVAAVVTLLERARLVVEPSGAATVAALLSGKVPGSGRRLVAVLSGGNVDLGLLADIIRGRDA